MKIKKLQCLVTVVWLTAFNSISTPLTLVTERNALLPPTAGGGGDSQLPVLTPDGRYIVFASTANNLATNSAGDAFQSRGFSKMNVFRRDRVAGVTTLISLNTSGTAGGTDNSFPTAISDNGRFVLFESSAPDLTPNDTNGLADVFLRDVWSNLTHLVSTTTNGFAGNNLSRGSTMTPNGRYVAFTSLATNLVSGDTNGIPDGYVRDMETGITILATPGSRGAAGYNPIGSESPNLSAEGRYLAFYSVATNVVPGVTNRGEIYLRDLVAESTLWISAAAHDIYGARAISFSHVLSADGNHLAYLASSNYPASSGSRSATVLRYNLVSGLTDIISTNAFVPMVNPEEFHELAMTADGRFISFVARNSSSPSSGSSIRRWDAQSSSTQLVSSNLSGGVTTFAFCARPVMDATGRYVAYVSNAGDLVTNSLTGEFQVFLTDVDLGQTVLVNAGTNGVGGGVHPLTVPQLSTNGMLVSFESPAANLVADDSNYAMDVFARDWTLGTNELVSVRAATLPDRTPNGPVSFDSYSASQNGQRVVFASEARNLVALDTNGLRDVFVRDLFGGSNVLVSVSTNGGVANGTSWEPTISPDGRYVAFTSDANDLVPGDTNRVADVFLRDLTLGQTWPVSVTPDGIGLGNGTSSAAIVGVDGRFVLFRSQARNLVASMPAWSQNIWILFQRDMLTGVTSVLTPGYGASGSATPDGRFVAFPHAPTAGSQIYVWDGVAKVISTNFVPGSNIVAVSISPDAKKVVYVTAPPSQVGFVDRTANTNGVIASGAYFGSRAGLRFSADSRCFAYAAATNSTLIATNRVYRYDFQSKELNLVSHAAGSQLPASGSSDSPDISGDGRFVVYRSNATNLLATDFNSEPDVYLYDARAGNNELLSTSLGASLPANNRSLAPVFSPDGQTLFFHTWAQDVVAGDFNQSGDVVGLPLLYIAISSEPPGTGATLSWPNRPGETYQVQFKDNPNAPMWQTLSGNITVVGNRATLTDTAPASDHRIYRVLAQ
jgi:Tol biopolymer transport system component